MKVTHLGGCHCGGVRFAIQAPAHLQVQRCNCSMCNMLGFEHVIVAARDFTLLSGAELLSEYTFNTGVAKHRFCKRCGIKSFYVPRSNPDGFSVNLRCLDRSTVSGVSFENFDGQNWEQAGHGLAHLSR